MQVKHIDHLNLSVANLAESVDWYARVFGFEVQEEGIYQGQYPWAIVRSGEALLCMYEHVGFRHLGNDEVRERRLHGINHFSFRIRDRASWESTIEREGLEIRYGGEVDWPHSAAWYVFDPTGYEIEVALWEGDRIAFGEPERQEHSIEA